MGLVLFAAVNLLIGVRLLLRFLGRRELGELTLGTSYVLAGGFGWTLVAGAGMFAAHDAALAERLNTTGTFAMNLGALAFATFVWATFRPQATWAKALVIVIGTLVTVSFAFNSVIQGTTYPGAGEPVQWLGVAGRDLAYVWGALEAFPYYGLLRKRLRHGLADPVVANRILCWGIGALTATGIAAVASLGYALSSDPRQLNVELAWLYTVLGTVGAVSTWLAFLPPRSYLRWVAGDSGAAVSVGESHG